MSKAFLTPTMAQHRCLNCNEPGAEPYDLMVRSKSHEDVYLCDECHEAILQEMADSA